MFNRFDIIGAYYLYTARFGYSGLPARVLRSRALASFRPGLTLSRAAARGSRYACQTALPKNDDYQPTRDALAGLLRRARRALRAA